MGDGAEVPEIALFVESEMLWVLKDVLVLEDPLTFEVDVSTVGEGEYGLPLANLKLSPQQFSKAAAVPGTSLQQKSSVKTPLEHGRILLNDPCATKKQFILEFRSVGLVLSGVHVLFKHFLHNSVKPNLDQYSHRDT